MTLEDRTKVILANVGKHYEDCTVRPCKCPEIIMRELTEAVAQERTYWQELVRKYGLK